MPTGCTEQQGPHLPVDFDTWFVEKACLAAAEHGAQRYGVRALVLPALPFGPTPEHRNYGSGYIHMPQYLHARMVASVLRSLAAQGFGRIVVWRGCGQYALEGVIAHFNRSHGGQAKAHLPALPYAAIMQGVAPGIPGGHADSFATAIALYLRPEAVRVDRIPDPVDTPVDWDDPHLDFARYSATGVIGDATHATAELGARLWHVTVETIARTFRAIQEAG